MVKRATTIAEANQQQLTIPNSLADNWRRFAGLIDGYAIAEELGAETTRWTVDVVQKAMKQGGFAPDVGILDLRLMLFFAYRADYFNGYTYTELNPEVDFILQALSERIGQPYTPLEAD